MIKLQPYAGKKVNVNIALNPELRKKAEQKAKELGMRSISALFAHLFQERFIDEYKVLNERLAIEGRVFLLTPIDENHSDWKGSTIRKSIVVLAENEEKAREYAAHETSCLTPVISGKPPPFSPWENTIRSTISDITMENKELAIGKPGIIKGYIIPVTLSHEVAISKISKIKTGDWIRVDGIDVYVLNKHQLAPNVIDVAYLRTPTEPVRRPAECRNEEWHFMGGDESIKTLDKEWIKTLSKGPTP